MVLTYHHGDDRFFISENLAFNKQTSQSSLAFGGASSRGVDGNSATDYGDNSCTHTATGQNKPWWMVDLGKVEHVTEVYIVNRNLAGGRLSNFEIRVGRLPFVTSPVTLTYSTYALTQLTKCK